MAMNVKIIRLISREELIAEVVSENEKTITIKNPLLIVVFPNKVDPKNPSVGLSPWTDFVETQEFTLDKSHALYIMQPIKEFVNQYNSIHGGIVVPNKPGLIIPG